MGKLAERFTDVNRSGVYRVSAAGVPRAAAIEACARLIEIRAPALGGDEWARIRSVLEGEGTRICVLLVSDASFLAAHVQQQTLAQLRTLAQAWRDSGRSFFAVLLDPERRLALPPLYHEEAAT